MKKSPDIPGYHLKKLLGTGAMSEVYLAVQKNLSRIVAIKILLPERFSNQRTLKRFLKEAQIASRLVHPNIITIYSVGRSKGVYYMVMEYLQESLKERLRRQGRYDPPQALDILLQLASALFFAHRKGFIHRDIKSENIMFRRDGTPVIVDFGIARAIESKTRLTQTGFSMGTPHYMSPEQCRAKKLDGRSDVYSLGVVFYEMLIGTVPYKSSDWRHVIIKHIQDEVPRLGWSLHRFQPLLDRMMAKQRSKRLGSEAELLQLVRPLIPPLTQNSASERPVTQKRKDGDRDQTRAVSSETGGSKKTPPHLKGSGRRSGQRKKRLLFFLFFLILTLLMIMFLLDTFSRFSIENLLKLW